MALRSSRALKLLFLLAALTPPPQTILVRLNPVVLGREHHPRLHLISFRGRNRCGKPVSQGDRGQHEVDHAKGEHEPEALRTAHVDPRLPQRYRWPASCSPLGDDGSTGAPKAG